MKQATRKTIETLLVLSLALAIYTSSSIQIKGNETEDANYSPLAGAQLAVNGMLESSDSLVENYNDTSVVGIPLEDAVMNENGEVVEAIFTPYTMYVTPSYLNVRSTPSTEEENIIGKLNINDEITIIGEEGDNWVIIDYNGQTAYICSEYIQETLPELDTYNYEWTGEKLNKHDGTANGPSGKETYYNLNMSRCIYYMQCLGYYEKAWERSDGVKMYGNYIMVAADLREHPKGSLVETSLGTGIVVDTGKFTTNGSGVKIDIAVNWK